VGPDRAWMTKIVDVHVTSHSKLLWIELKHGNPKG